eukprot:scaffold15728_cov51-Isochrysis_galbana.AAC.1
MKRNRTASEDPTSAIHTTDTADGTRTRKSPKWSFARRKPKADDFIDVSMATVRQTVSGYTCGRVDVVVVVVWVWGIVEEEGPGVADRL